MTRIVIVEDHLIVRQGLKLLLDQESDFELVGEAGDGIEAMELVGKLRPDVVLLDLMIPRLHGLEVVKQVRRDFPKIQVVVLSMHADEPYVIEAIRNGAMGYVLKECTATDLAQAVREVFKGRQYLSRPLSPRAKAVLEKQSPKDQNLELHEMLTKREQMVLKLAAEGFSSVDIGNRLFISPRTAETHRANLMRKLGFHSQTDLVRFAIRKGIIPQ